MRPEYIHQEAAGQAPMPDAPTSDIEQRSTKRPQPPYQPSEQGTTAADDHLPAANKAHAHRTPSRNQINSHNPCDDHITTKQGAIGTGSMDDCTYDFESPRYLEHQMRIHRRRIYQLQKPGQGQGGGTGNSTGDGGVTWEAKVEASRGDLNGRAGCNTSPRWSSSLATQQTREEDSAAVKSTVAQRNANPANPNNEDSMESKGKKAEATNLGRIASPTMGNVAGRMTMGK